MGAELYRNLLLPPVLAPLSLLLSPKPAGRRPLWQFLGPEVIRCGAKGWICAWQAIENLVTQSLVEELLREQHRALFKELLGDEIDLDLSVLSTPEDLDHEYRDDQHERCSSAPRVKVSRKASLEQWLTVPLPIRIYGPFEGALGIDRPSMKMKTDLYLDAHESARARAVAVNYRTEWALKVLQKLRRAVIKDRAVPKGRDGVAWAGLREAIKIFCLKVEGEPSPEAHVEQIAKLRTWLQSTVG